jgi:PAS domain S-box-containing protein/diguanylate cyclase (GGDEF)-like protein
MHFFMRGLIENCPLPLVVKDRRGKIVLINKPATDLYGHDPADLIGRDTHDIFPTHLARHFAGTEKRVLESGTVVEEDFETSVSGEALFSRVVKFPLFDGNSRVCGTGTYVIDLTDFKQLESTLEKRTHFDEVTSLPNREFIAREITGRIGQDETDGAPFTVLVISLDGLGRIEKAMGKETRNKALIAAIERLREAMERNDVLAILANRDIVIVHPHNDGARKSAALARSIVNKFATPMSIDGNAIFLLPRIGMVEFPKDGSEADALLSNASAALEHCATANGSIIASYEPKQDLAARRRLDIETQLRHALHRNEFQLSYQPQIDPRTEAIVGAEALIRWYNPELGYVAPNEFIPIAEETGLVLPIERWVLETACREAAEWCARSHPGVRVAVNVSATQLLSRDFVRFVSRVIRESGLPSRRLEIEITERLVLEGGREVSRNLESLKKLNVMLAIDDFGTGYSSLKTLKNFPFDVVKIDKSFVDDISNSPEDLALTKTIVAMARNLGLKSVAEGVESEHQRKLLCDLRVDILQGYYYSRPVTAFEFRQYLNRHAVRRAA